MRFIFNGVWVLIWFVDCDIGFGLGSVLWLIFLFGVNGKVFRVSYIFGIMYWGKCCCVCVFKISVLGVCCLLLFGLMLVII